MSDEGRRQIITIVAGLVGEFIREMAVLIAVFAPLDAFTRAAALTVWMVFATIATVTALLAVGILLEVKRP